MIRRVIRTLAVAGIALGLLTGLGVSAAQAADGDPSQWSVTGDPSQWG